MTNITFQGALGAYSHIACENIFPNGNYIPADTFEDAMDLVKNNKVDYAVIPIENSNAGRVTDVYFLLPQTNLYIVGEYFLRIEHQLLALPNVKIKDIKNVASHPQALSQCSGFIKKHELKPMSQIDTAKSCLDIIEKDDKTTAVIASKKAAEIYNMNILASNIENDNNNTTRFLVMSKNINIPQQDGNNYISSLIFDVKHRSSSLYKALGAFAENNINITKLESYVLDGNFVSARFYIEIEGHCEDVHVKKSLEKLKLNANNIHFLGTYLSYQHR